MFIKLPKILKNTTNMTAATISRISLNQRAPIRAIPPSLIEQGIQTRLRRNHAWLEMGEGEPIIYLHGLMGGVFNCPQVFGQLSAHFRMIMPFQPMYDLPKEQTNCAGLAAYLLSFINELRLPQVTIIGHSTGGCVATHFAATNPERVKALILTGSAGLSNTPLNTGFIQRKNPEYIYEGMQAIYADPSVADPKAAQEVYEASQNSDTLGHILRLTRDVTINKTYHLLPKIAAPTLLLWGDTDMITPTSCAHDFHNLIPNSELHFLDKCGHAPLQEFPEQSLFIIENFLGKALKTNFVEETAFI
ncbi:MAG: alpha/beta hydrolase [Saprospiraceae bacterium]|nr:alpha/beta hydrolase [Saprospiraceae bacterium]